MKDLLLTNSFNKHFCLVLLLLSASCKKESALSGYGKSFEKIIKTEQGIFRGIELGVRLQEVKKRESQLAPAEEEVDYLYYEIKADSTLFSIAYNFVADSLNEIQVDASLESEEEANELFNSFQLYFNNKYGTGITDKGYSVWKTDRAPTGSIEITLTDESADEKGRLSISFYRSDY